MPLFLFHQFYDSWTVIALDQRKAQMYTGKEKGGEKQKIKVDSIFDKEKRKKTHNGDQFVNQFTVAHVHNNFLRRICLEVELRRIVGRKPGFPLLDFDSLEEFLLESFRAEPEILIGELIAPNHKNYGSG